MKKIYLLLTACATFYYSHAQVNLPHVLTFSSDEPSWTAGVARDGEGGSEDIIGLEIQIFTASATFGLEPGSTITWKTNTYFTSDDATYNGLTSGPDVEATNNGVPAMVMKSASTAVNFSLQSITLYDWGGYSPLMISTYDNGVLVGTIEVAFATPPAYPPKTISQADELTPSLFSDVDEIRFYPKSPQTVFNLSMNYISLAAPGALPVEYEYFRGAISGADCQLEWATAQEQQSSHFTIEHSTNGRQFSKVGTVKAMGNSTVKQVYNFSYPVGNDPVHLFRLRQVDLDGKESLSEVISLRNTNVALVSVAPNPTVGRVKIVSETGNIEGITVYDMNGKRWLHLEKPGTRIHTADLTPMPSGMYIIHVRTGSGLEKIKVVKN